MLVTVSSQKQCLDAQAYGMGCTCVRGQWSRSETKRVQDPSGDCLQPQGPAAEQ